MRICTLLLGLFLLHYCAFAQQTPTDSIPQHDMIDALHGIFDKVSESGKEDKPHKINLSVIPTLGYTLSTGFAAGISSVATFYTQPDHSLNTSVINAQAFFDSNNQKTLFIQANIWADHDNYKLVSDFRITKYPDVTYGLGNEAKVAEDITYNYLRLYQTFLRRIDGHFYVGIGYNLDYHYEITNYRTKPKVRTNYEKYTGPAVPSTSTSSGYNFDFLYDSRRNPINAIGGMYVNLIFRNNYKFLRSDVDYTSAVFDIRKYFKLSKHSNNVLAIWSYDWMILSGKPPYLDLPSTGADMYNNTGRGYTIDRFRGNNMIYLEAEYRFGITRNGLLGGVVFGNAANYSKNITDDLQNILPAGGAGLRLKINKHSNTNLCVDYGFGTQGSRGFFVNLGEVF